MRREAQESEVVPAKKHHVVSFFTTPDDLAMRVTQDAARLMQECGVPFQESALAQIVNNLPLSIVLKGDKIMEKEGSVSPEFVKAFEQHLSEHRRLPIFVRRDAEGEAANPVQDPDDPASESEH